MCLTEIHMANIVAQFSHIHNKPYCTTEKKLYRKEQKLLK